LDKAGDEAASSYKVKNAEKLMKMSESEQEKAIKDARMDGMNKKATELGMSAKDRDDAISGKGYRDSGSATITGMLGNFAKQKKNKSSSESLADKKVKTKFTRDETKEAMETMDADARKEFIDHLEKGDIKVERTKTKKVKDAAKDVFLGRGIKKIGKKAADAAIAAKKFFKDKDYDEARDELIASGEISDMAKGSNWTRSAEEKEKIIERQKKNKAQKDASIKTAPKPKHIAGLAQEAETLDELENEDETSNVRSSDSVIGKIIGRRKTTFGGSDVEKYKREAAERQRANMAGNIDDEISETEGLIDSKYDENDAMQAKIDIINNDPAFKKQRDNLDKYKDSLQKSTNSSDRQMWQRKIDAIEEDSDYMKKDSSVKEFEHDIVENDSSIKNAGDKLAKLTEIKGRFDEAESIRGTVGKTLGELADDYDTKAGANVTDNYSFAKSITDHTPGVSGDKSRKLATAAMPTDAQRKFEQTDEYKDFMMAKEYQGILDDGGEDFVEKLGEFNEKYKDRKTSP
jgi:hypothetical protein